MAFKTGDRVTVNLPMDHHHGRRGAVEASNGESNSVKFDDNARAFYKDDELHMDKPFEEEGQEPEDPYPKLDVRKALLELVQKTDSEIETETAYTWTARACAALQIASLSEDEEVKNHFIDWADRLEHEGLEHAALVKDYGATVGECQRAVDSYRETLTTDSLLTKSDESVNKDQPGSSSVHVNAPLGSEDDEIMKTKAHDKTNIEELKAALGKLSEAMDSFLTEEENEDVEKGDLTSEGRDHIGEDNFALPSQRKYPIHDISHARNALARVAQRGNLDEQQKVKSAVYRKYPSLKPVEKDAAPVAPPLKKKPPVPPVNPDPTTGPTYTDPDSNADMYPELDNLEAEILKAAFDQDEASDDNETDSQYGMQELVEGMDWELEHTTIIPQEAKAIAEGQLDQDPDHYKKLRIQADGSDDVLTKDTQQTEDDPFAGEGYNLDLGSGPVRENGHIGLDTFPYDHGTIVHDLNMGIPFPDKSVSRVHMSNTLHEMDDPKALLSEVHRVLMPGGQFVYQGPEDIYNYPGWTQDYPGLVMTNHEDGIQKADEGDDTPVRQTFTRVATPDPATANDAEPRIGVAQFDQLPADALLNMNAADYMSSDSTSSGRGNRIHGYPSQGALMNKSKTDKPEKPKYVHQDDLKAGSFYKLSKDQMAEMNDDGNSQALTLPEQQVHDAFHPAPVNPPRPPKIRKSIESVMKSGIVVPIMKKDGHKQIVYGVVLAPNEIDAQEDFMTPDDIEAAAHRYLSNSRVIGKNHSEPIQAVPVESFIAPCDFDVAGQYGPQTVTKGSWVLGVKVNDPEQWQKIVDEDYTGFSVGGVGARQQT